jgi:thymidine kinase
MSLELILGPMFAGKSSAACQIIRRNNVINRPTFCITSALDTRYSQEARITSHNKESYPATAASSLLPLLETNDFTASECVIIEEAQFFSDLKEFVLKAVDTHKKDVICVGLDGDSERRPFGQLLDLVPYADKFSKLTALCTRCGDGTNAIFTFRKPGNSGDQVAVGGEDKYQPLCRKHYLEGNAELAIEGFIADILSKGVSEPLQQIELCVKKFGSKEGVQVYEQLLKRLGKIPPGGASA